MSFESRVHWFSERFVSGRSFDLIVAPALADLEFDGHEERQTMNRLAVLRAVAGAVHTDFKSQMGTFLLLSLVPAGYYFVLMVVCFDFFSGGRGADSVVTPMTFLIPISLLSLTPALVCFWPERPGPRSVE